MNDRQAKQRGSALIIALFVIVVIAAFVGIAVTLTTGTLRRTDSSRDFAALRAAAEGSLDFAYGIWAKTINSYYRPVTKKELATNMAKVPSFADFDYAPVSKMGHCKSIR